MTRIVGLRAGGRGREDRLTPSPEAAAAAGGASVGMTAARDAREARDVKATLRPVHAAPPVRGAFPVTAPVATDAVPDRVARAQKCVHIPTCERQLGFERLYYTYVFGPRRKTVQRQWERHIYTYIPGGGGSGRAGLKPPTADPRGREPVSLRDAPPATGAPRRSHDARHPQPHMVEHYEVGAFAQIQ